KQAAKIGKSIPEDIQVIGFDGVQGFEFSSREISTIQQPLDLIASAAVEELLELMDSREKQGRRIVLPVEFIKGDSTK
ncbi:MAG: substrate-binding domain-containing protein, partial [Bacillaceae bacterium]